MRTRFNLHSNGGIEDQAIFFQTIKVIESVLLPGKLVVAELPLDGSAEQTSLTWSRGLQVVRSLR